MKLYGAADLETHEIDLQINRIQIFLTCVALTRDFPHVCGLHEGIERKKTDL